MAHDSATYTSLLAAIDIKIADLVANPQVNWREGNVSIDAGDKMDQLIALREKVVAWFTAVPAEEIVTMQTLITEFGEDIAEYVHEEI